MFKPVNRYIYIEVPKTKPIETLSGIVLPDDYKPKEERTVLCRWLIGQKI